MKHTCRQVGTKVDDSQCGLTYELLSNSAAQTDHRNFKAAMEVYYQDNAWYPTM